MDSERAYPRSFGLPTIMPLGSHSVICPVLGMSGVLRLESTTLDETWSESVYKWEASIIFKAVLYG